MSYWDNFSWDGSPATPIGTLLESDSATVKDFLDEDQIITELKRNKNLKDFFAVPANLDQVIDFIVTPYTGEGEEGKYRYPFLSYQILTFKYDKIEEYFMKTESLDRFFGFVYQAPPLDSLLCSYFDKIVIDYLPRHHERIVDYLQGKEGLLEQLVIHMYSPLITDVIVRLLGCSSDEAVDAWFAEVNILGGIVQKLDPSCSLEEHENATTVLFHICTLAFQKINGGLTKPILYEQLSSEKYLKRMLEFICKDVTSSSFTEAASIFIILCQEERSSISNNANMEDLPAVFRVLIDAIPQFLECLSKAPDSEVITTTGVMKAPFGMRRSRVLDLFEVLLSCKAACIISSFLDHEVFAKCFDLFFEYQWNNFVHHSVTNISKPVLDSGDDELIIRFVEQTNLHQRIGDAGAVPNVNGEKSSRKGFMGHLGLLSTSLHSAAEQCDRLSDKLDACESWKKYLKTDFAAIKKIEAAEAENNDQDAASLAEQITLFKEVTKKSFEDDFPDSFTPASEDYFDILIPPTDNRLFVGINTDEQEFGGELDSDEEDNFMANDDYDEEDEDM